MARSNILVVIVVALMATACEPMQVRAELPQMTRERVMARIGAIREGPGGRESCIAGNVGLVVALENYVAFYRGSWVGWTKEAEAYAKACAQVMDAAASADIVPFLMCDEQDPRWDSIGYVLFVSYSENTRRIQNPAVSAGGWAEIQQVESSMELANANMGAAPGVALGNTLAWSTQQEPSSVIVAVPSYNCVVFSVHDGSSQEFTSEDSLSRALGAIRGKCSGGVSTDVSGPHAEEQRR